jgi:CheY-like chemotaxis protein
MIYGFGPRATWVYTTLRERLTNGELSAGTKLPSHVDLAAEFGVAPLTMRQVLAILEDEGLVTREQGRGTFVRTPARRAVLIVDDALENRALLRTYVERAGYRAITMAEPSGAIVALETDSDISLVFSDVRMPTTDVGIDFIRSVRRRWPQIPLAALTGYPDDLAELHGTPECPILVLAKPAWGHQIDQALQMALPPQNKPLVTRPLQGQPEAKAPPELPVREVQQGGRARRSSNKGGRPDTGLRVGGSKG